MHKKHDEIRDIYQGSTHDFEKDFTPQIARELVETRQRDLRRSRVVSILFGALVIVLAVVLIAVVIRDFLGVRTPSGNAGVQEQLYMPRSSLPAESLWVMDYRPELAEDTEEIAGPKPLSTKWIKKAAYHIILGQQALAINEPAQALENFEKVVTIYPDIQGIHRAIGLLHLQRKEYALAVEHLEKALQEGEAFDVVSNLGSAYIGAGNYEKAETYLKRALQMQAENPVGHKNLAALYQKMKRDNDAVYHFEKYLDLQSDDIDTMQTYALYLTKIGRWKEAATFLTQLTQEVPDVAPIYFLLAQVQVQNGQQDKAMEALKRGIQLVDPKLALAWMSREEFNSVRNTGEFKTLTDQLEIQAVSPEPKR